ncbi:hypothetical protein GRF91_004973 [Salmonella enterica]|nr:hypothetical protein [Salmonella enterica]
MAMKKTLMAGMVALCAMSGMNAAQAAAATSGTQTFKANITASTCSISGLSGAVAIGSINSATIDSVSAWHVPAGAPVVKYQFSVSGCPASYTQVEVTPSFTSEGGNYSRFVKNSGTAKGISLDTGKLSEGDWDTSRIWESGKKKTFTLSKGAVTVPVTGGVSKNAQAAAAGTVDFKMSFTFDFV